MARPIAKSKDSELVKQSNYITTARYEYTAQEKRILYRVVEKAYEFRNAHKEYFASHDGKYKVNQHVSFTMPITHFMTVEQLTNCSGKDYEEVIDAFKSLVDKRISFRGKGEFSFGGILNYADQIKGQGAISFMVHKFVWQSALDFTQGFTKVDLVIAMKLKSPYSMRFYEIAKQYQGTGFWVVSMEEFRAQFGCLEKYPRADHLKRYVIDLAQAELDAKSPISFTYVQEKRGRKITALKFSFYKKANELSEKEDKRELLSKYPSAVLDKQMKDWLTYRLHLTQKQRDSNIKLWDDLLQQFGDGAIDEMDETYRWIASQGFEPSENIGWVIQNLKAKLANAQDGQEANPDGQQKLDAIRNRILNK